MPEKGRFKNRTGEVHTTNEGLLIKIVDCSGVYNCTVEFEDGTILESVNYSNIKKGGIRKPINRIGEIYTTKQGDLVEIINFSKSGEYAVRFIENGLIINNLWYSNIKKGQVVNPYHPTVCGIGYIGVGKYDPEDYKLAKSKWRMIIRRCYDEKEQLKNPTYKECTLYPKWECFQNFAEWFENNYNPDYMEDWHVDKDILVKGSKIYSPDTCEIVPRKINNILLKNEAKRGKYPIGVSFNKRRNKFVAQIQKTKLKSKVIDYFDTPEEAFEAYKIEKEKYIKEVADEWKDLISERCYKALYNYKVEITD